jgi:hypothetical protein
MASRIGADPLMVMQNLYVVHGRPGWSSQFLIATFNQSGRFSSLRYEYFGEKDKDSYGCRAWAVEKDTGQRLTGSDITVGLAKIEGWYGRNGSKWKTMPQQMLAYRAAAWFIRTHAPEIAMGLRTVEEIEDMPGEVNITSKATEIERSPEPTSKLDALTDTLRQNGAEEKRKPGRPKKVESADAIAADKLPTADPVGLTAPREPELPGLEFESPNPFQP